MNRIRWTERKFDLDLPIGNMPMILERLRGTASRIEEMIKGLPEDLLRKNISGKWSIKEHIGHLSDLEELHEGRIDDLIALKTELRAADMGNKKTNEAKHNAKDISVLLHNFRLSRSEFVKRLSELPDNVIAHSSLHPRLQRMMKPVDMAYFVAEHDDQHLALMREIVVASGY